MIISVHLPKTAGSSFVSSLEEHFGAALMKDYADFPLNTPVYERNRHAYEQSLLNAEKDFSGIKCIHGHFMPVKYLLLGVKQKTVFVAWMRNPVERLLSHYYYWKMAYDASDAPRLHRRMIEEGWSLERFCLGPELRNVYAQFLWGFPMSYFDFIGVTEFYQQELSYFAQNFLGVDLGEKRINVGEKKGGRYDMDSALRKEIEKYHSIDMLLWNKAKGKRRERTAATPPPLSLPPAI